MKKKIIIVLVLIIIFLPIAGNSVYFLLNKDDFEKIKCKIVHCQNNEKEGNQKEKIPENKKPINGELTEISDPRYPFKILSTSPLGFDDIEFYYQKSLKRYKVSYYSEIGYEGEKEFKEKIEPYVKLYLASSEYMFQEYEETFSGNNPQNDIRESLYVSVYEKCEDVSTSLNGNVCKDLRMIGSTSPFTYKTSLYLNLNHSEFKDYYVMHVSMHETIHLLTYTYDQSVISAGLPDWYKESIAEGILFDPDMYKREFPDAFVDFEYPKSLEELNDWYNDADDKNKMRIAYQTGSEFFNYLLGKTELSEYLKLSTKRFSYLDNEFENEFVKIYGKGSNEIYEEFLSNR